MENKDTLLPVINLEVKRAISLGNGLTYSLFQLEKFDLESLSLLYNNRSRFREITKLMDKICAQSTSEDIDLLEFKFIIDANSKQDAFSTILYIVNRLNESNLCDCTKIYKGNTSDLNDMGEYRGPGIYNINNGIAGIQEENDDEDDSDVPVPKWQQEEKEAVFFICDYNALGTFDYSSLPSTSKLNEISNKIIFMINITAENDKINTSNLTPFLSFNNEESSLLDYVLHGFKRIEVKNFENEELVKLFLKYISSKGFNLHVQPKFTEQEILKLRKSLNYHIRELDIKSLADAVINNYIINRNNSSERSITESSFKLFTESRSKVLKKQDASLQNPWKELDKIVGMEDIKIEIHNLVNRLKLENSRRKKGLPASGINMNAVFLGSPGTNKTSMARLLARILEYEKITPSNNFKECGKEDIVGQYVGWTAVKVRELFESISMNGTSGGVLFLDEAYSITDDQTSFDKEAINTLVQCMENFRNKVVVIFGGYKQKMLEFMNKNEGLRSRISFVIEFKNYSNKELLEITKYQASLSGFKLVEDCDMEIINYFEVIKRIRGDNFGNGREARNLFEYASLELSTRLYQKKRPSKADLINITLDDVKNAINKALQREKTITADRNIKRAIGFTY